MIWAYYDNLYTRKMQRYERGDRKTVAYRILKTLALFLCWICLGLWNEIQGPTLNDLRRLVGANIEEISRVLSARSGGTLAGSLIGGFLHDRFKKRRDLFIAVAMTMSGLGILVAPHSGKLWLMGIFFFVQGLGHGILTTGGNPTIIVLWADLAAGYLLLLHSGYGLGAALSPLLAAPFLSRNKTVNHTAVSYSDADYSLMTFNSRAENTINGHSDFAGYNTPYDPFNPFDIQDTYDQWSSVFAPGQENGTNVTTVLTPTRIQIPYMIIGVLCFALAIWFLGFFIIKMPQVFRNALLGVNSEKVKTKQMFSPESCAGGSRAFGIQMILLIFFFFLFVTGVQRAYGKFVYTYARKSALRFSQADSALLNSLYWVSFTVARLIAFAVAKWVPVHILLFIQVFGTAVSAIFLNIFHDKRVPFLIFTSFFGFFQSPLYPSCLGWLNRYMEVTSMVVVVANVGSSTGGILIQWFTGFLFQNYGPRSFLYTMVAYSVLIALFFVFMHFVAHRHGDRFKHPTNESCQENGGRFNSASISNSKVCPETDKVAGVSVIAKGELTSPLSIVHSEQTAK